MPCRATDSAAHSRQGWAWSLTTDPFPAGSIYIPAFAPANYTFYMDSDDGSLLTIDGNVVISDPGAVLRQQLVT